MFTLHPRHVQKELTQNKPVCCRQKLYNPSAWIPEHKIVPSLRVLKKTHRSAVHTNHTEVYLETLPPLNEAIK